jgi:zinc/manganese transport system substrate-binding protein
MKRLVLSLICCAAMSLSVGAQAKEKLTVVTSFSILGDMVTQVGGEHVTVKTLVGPDSDAHTFMPTPSDVKTLGSADVFVTNGLDFENWTIKLMKTAKFKGVIVIASAGVQPLDGEGAEHGEDAHHHAVDPHAWQSLTNGMTYVANIRDALAKADPEHANEYEANAKHFNAELNALDTWVKAEIAKVPETKRKVITTHDAFRYFGKAYGVTLIAPVGVNTESEPGAKDMARIIDLIRQEHITALFLENISDNRLIEQLRHDGGATIGGTLYSDALSGEGGPATNYVAMFRHNVNQLIPAMQGNPGS